MSELSTTNSQPARTVEAVTLEIQTLQRQAQQLLLGYAIEIGRRLVEVKAMLPHGQWGTYIKEQVGYSQSTANNLMRIFEEYGTAQQSIFGPEAISQAIGNLSYTKALRLLALPGRRAGGICGGAQRGGHEHPGAGGRYQGAGRRPPPG